MRFMFEWIAMRKEAAEALERRNTQIQSDIQRLFGKVHILRDRNASLEQEVKALTKTVDRLDAELNEHLNTEDTPRPGFYG